MPAYNEAHAILDLLDRVAPHVDGFIFVDDCSKDATVSLVREWKRARANFHLIALPKNVGASGALKVGYLFVTHLLATGALAPNDLVMEIDSDGQHDPRYIPVLRARLVSNESLDVVLARRDFSVYPRYKRFGNFGLTLIASVLSGFPYQDVESNYRFSRAHIFPRLLEFFSGYRYSGAFEVGIILGLLKCRIQNDFVIEVPFYRGGARATDGAHVLWMGLRAWFKVKLGLKNSPAPERIQELLTYLIND
jgi:glycosyltransferase involved in cell wall biosynthesis